VLNALIFCNRKVEVDILYKSLKKHGFSVGALHGDLDQSQRFATLNAFKAGELQLLVCSDVAARGLDIGGLSHVFNFDVPFHAEDYVHRIGRTGRAGREGHAYSIATADDAKLVAAIEKLTGKPIPRVAIEGLDPVTDDEIAEAMAAKRSGRGRGAPAARGGRDAGRSGSRAEPRREAGRGGTRTARDEGRRAPAEAASRDERRPRRERTGPAERSAAERDAAIERESRPAAPPERRRDEPRREERRDDRRDERRHRADDLGPPVRGFGDQTPAFMLIPLPRPKRDPAPEAEAA
jgi:superfamily II DNA/RNA helicase